MKLTDFDYHLPPELIAQTPLEPRDSSRLLVVEKSSCKLKDKIFHDMADELTENDVLVVNKTRVINARLKGYLETGKEVEIFLHKQISDTSWDCLVYPGKKLKIGTKVYFDSFSSNKNFNLKQNFKLSESQSLIGGVFEDLAENQNSGLTAKITEVSEKGRIVTFNIGGLEFLKIVEQIGHTPLPPYIKETLKDSERYQTVYNEIEGSAAAPTAGLHFTDELLEKLEQKGIVIEKVLLHVGLGTFVGVETENIEDHHMHSEYIELKEDVAERLNNYKKQGKRIIAVGTTSVRVLESFSDENGYIQGGESQTEIFIYPGYSWKFVDSLITNFHLPKSTLIMLVSSLAGEETIKKAYAHAVSEKYRFFSFGDAMWIK